MTPEVYVATGWNKVCELNHSMAPPPERLGIRITATVSHIQKKEIVSIV